MFRVTFNALLLVCMISPEVHGLVEMHLTGARANTTALVGGDTVKKEMTYTQNGLCRQNYCINPLFPGLGDLPRLEQLQWQCATFDMVKPYMDFCSGAIQYSPALPSPVKAASPVDELVRAQDDAAMTMFFYHLSGMGYEPWDYRRPKQIDNECVRTVWKMVCYTYFPRSEAGCKVGEQSLYKRPCSSSCQNYIQQCGVECCDESVSCVFQHTSTDSQGKVELLQTGYVDQLGPSAACTGGSTRTTSSSLMLLLGILGFHLIFAQDAGSARKSSAPAKSVSKVTRRYLLWGALLVLALSLHGCDGNIPKHTTGNWRTKTDYLQEYKYLAPGQAARNAILNSCSLPDASPKEQCSGRGYCRSFSKSSIHAQNLKPLAFCMCDADYADPECSTKRKSQMTAFFLSLSLGYVGADYFYLGFPLWGMGKLVTLGGFGFWWIVDIVRMGSGPIYAYNFRTSADLPHWIAMFVIFGCCSFLGFLVAIEWYLGYRKKRRDDFARLEHGEEGKHLKGTAEDLGMAGDDGPRMRPKRNRAGQIEGPGGAGFSGYGATLPQPPPNGGAPMGMMQGTNGSSPYAGPTDPYAQFTA